MIDVSEQLARAVSLREAGSLDEARDLLLKLSSAAPDDSRVAYQTAWVHDRIGLEREAIPFYVRALDGDGLYAEAVSVLSAGVAEFPDDRALAVFLAMARYNAGDAKEAVAGLLTMLADTSADPEIKGYERAIRLYAEDLDRVWD